MRRAHDHRMRLIGQVEIRGKGRLAGEEASVLQPWHGLADEGRRHGGFSLIACARGSEVAIRRGQGGSTERSRILPPSGADHNVAAARYARSFRRKLRARAFR
jgi:hypothetical protein